MKCKLKSEAFAELAMEGFAPRYLSYTGSYYLVDSSEFESFMRSKGHEKGLDWSITGDVINNHIVMRERAEVPETRPIFEDEDECRCPICRPDLHREVEEEEEEPDPEDTLKESIRGRLESLRVDLTEDMLDKLNEAFEDISAEIAEGYCVCKA